MSEGRAMSTSSGIEVASGSTPSHTNALRRLVEAAWRAHAKVSVPPAVHPSIPILFFGDYGAYFDSAIRIVTVGLNPSSQEFPTDGPFSRFPSSEQLIGSGCSSDADRDLYLRCLPEYYRVRPYWKWFNGAFQSVLQGAGAAYFGSANTALHTDLCSPIATSPTWSKLSKSDRELLIEDGLELWHELIDGLQPDVVILSVARRHLEAIAFRADTSWSPVYRLDRRVPYEVLGSWRILTSGRRTLFAYGQAAQLPFGSVPAAAKIAIGRTLAALASNGSNVSNDCP